MDWTEILAAFAFVWCAAESRNSFRNQFSIFCHSDDIYILEPIFRLKLIIKIRQINLRNIQHHERSCLSFASGFNTTVRTSVKESELFGFITAVNNYYRRDSIHTSMACLHEADLTPQRWRYRAEGAVNCVFEYISVCAYVISAKIISVLCQVVLFTH